VVSASARLAREWAARDGHFITAYAVASWHQVLRGLHYAHLLSTWFADDTSDIPVSVSWTGLVPRT
jgi:hypothetical protein